MTDDGLFEPGDEVFLESQFDDPSKWVILFLDGEYACITPHLNYAPGPIMMKRSSLVYWQDLPEGIYW